MLILNNLTKIQYAHEEEDLMKKKSRSQSEALEVVDQAIHPFGEEHVRDRIERWKAMDPE